MHTKYPFAKMLTQRQSCIGAISGAVASAVWLPRLRCIGGFDNRSYIRQRASSCGSGAQEREARGARGTRGAECEGASHEAGGARGHEAGGERGHDARRDTSTPPEPRRYSGDPAKRRLTTNSHSDIEQLDRMPKKLAKQPAKFADFAGKAAEVREYLFRLQVYLQVYVTYFMINESINQQTLNSGLPNAAPVVPLR
jgi:hypothetical protein